MTSLPPNADELVSAYVDGEAAPDEITLIESTPELMAQVDALRSMSSLIGAPVAPPQEQKEAHLAAALGAFDELFATNADQETSDTTAPLSSVASSPDTPVVAIDESDTVTSLDAARERRRPRRFNTGVIAAAVAALLLFVGLAALSLGSSTSEDVATSASDASSASASDSASDASDDSAGDDEAMADEEQEAGGLSDADSLNRAEALPAATAPPPAAAQAAPSNEADADEAMADEEEAMEDEEAMDDEEAAVEAVEDSVAGDAAASADIDARADFLFGDFATEDALKSQLEEFTALDLELRGAEIGQGLFPRCQRSIPELANIGSPTLVGDAFVAQQVFEVHYVAGPDGGATIYIVNPDQCSIQLTVPIVP